VRATNQSQGDGEEDPHMTTMKAAVVSSFEEPPHYREFEVPRPTSEDEVLVEVLAAGLHPRVRSDAAGRHYTSTGRLPMIPGVDAVGRRPDGTLVYFVADDDTTGTMAEKAVADVRRSIELPDGVDVAEIAAAMNPAMSSWIALRRRVALEKGQRVLVLGATGNAGTMAVQIAGRLGAGAVVAAGRDVGRLEALGALGADATVQLTGDPDATAAGLAAAAADVDIVIDYLWGAPAQHAMVALLSARSDRSRRLDWIQIGAIAGPTIELPSVALRSANLRLQGSGQGSVSAEAYRAELPSLVEQLRTGTIAINAIPTPLAEVEAAWVHPDGPGRRTVLVP
jgi:NADPH:quinone reductase-like Zn-dependent oxidoreductase